MPAGCQVSWKVFARQIRQGSGRMAPDERWRDKKAEAPSSIGPFFAAGDTVIYQSGDTPSLPSMSLTVTSVFEHDRDKTASGRGPALPRVGRTLA